MTHIELAAHLNRNGFPKFPGYTMALEYVCIKESFIPDLLELIREQLIIEGFTSPGKTMQECRQAVLSAQNHVCFICRHDPRWPKYKSPAVAVTPYFRDKPDAKGSYGHIVLDIVTKGKNGKLKDNWADIINGCKLIELSENEQYQIQHWDVNT